VVFLCRLESAGFVPAHFENRHILKNRQILKGTFFAECVNYCIKNVSVRMCLLQECAGFVPAQNRHILNRLASFYLRLVPGSTIC
jgi:hypothetical protein